MGRILYYICNVSHGGSEGRVGHTCDAPYFRVDRVDAIVWNWVTSILLDPAALENGLRDYQKENAAAISPIRARVTKVEKILSETQSKLDRLLDIYLDGHLDKETFVGREDTLKQQIADLEAEHKQLVCRLETNSLSPERIQSIYDFAEQIRNGLDIINAANDFAKMQQLVNLLDVRVGLGVGDEGQVVYASCVLDSNVALYLSSVSL
jgi:site-specific DNA recombinase